MVRFKVIIFRILQVITPNTWPRIVGFLSNLSLPPRRSPRWTRKRSTVLSSRAFLPTLVILDGERFLFPWQVNMIPCQFGRHLLICCVSVKYFSPMTNVAIIRVGRDQHRIAWGGVTLLKEIDAWKIIPYVVHVSGTRLLCPSCVSSLITLNRNHQACATCSHCAQ